MLRGVGAKQIAIHAARPAHHAGEPARVEFALERFGGDHHADAGVVEATKERVDQSAWRHSPHGEIFREARVVGTS